MNIAFLGAGAWGTALAASFAARQPALLWVRDAEVDLDLRLHLLEQDLRRVGLLERQVLQVHALDLEHGIRIGVGHGGLSVR